LPAAILQAGKPVGAPSALPAAILQAGKPAGAPSALPATILQAGKPVGAPSALPAAILQAGLSMVAAPRRWLCADLALLDYEEARDLQLRLVTARASGIIVQDILLLMEHEPVFTLGRRGGRQNLRVSELFLEEVRIPIVHVERGGDITFHGPGQLVGYPIVDLRAAKLTVTGYVERLEEIMIRTVAHWGVHATGNRLNHGIWVDGRKLGSLGIAIRRGIAFHGFALNVNVSLEPFGWINPCGLHGVKMTSLEQQIARKASMKEVREQIKRNIEEVFDVDLNLEIPRSCGISCMGLLDRDMQR
jgi:lipoate-protein ligase B